MKKILLVLAMAVLVGCATNINHVQDQWGPPAKVEQLENGNSVWYWYVNTGKGSAVAGVVGDQGSGIAIGQGTSYSGWMVHELTVDKEGKVIKKRKYWKQPKLD
jgi:uncharacterized protein YceK